MTRIQDEFTNRPISKQRRYQLRKVKEKRCPVCGKPIVSREFCARHLAVARERRRRRTAAVRRYKNALSYRLQKTKTPPTASAPLRPRARAPR